MKLLWIRVTDPGPSEGSLFDGFTPDVGGKGGAVKKRGRKAPDSRAAQLRLPLFLDRAANKRSAVEPPIKRVLCTLAGTFRRCRRRISGTYRTYGTYRTKADRMANFFSADLLWCGSRPSIQRMKKSSDYTSSASCQSHMSPMSHMSSQK